MGTIHRLEPEDLPYGPGNPDYENDGQEVIAPVRFSHLRAYGRSAMHGHHARQKEAEQTTAMERGSAVHALVFGTRKVCGYPGSQRRGKDYEAFAAEHPDSEILTASEYEKARQMADAVRECKLAEPMLQGITETTIRFRWMGLDCRATPDVRGTDYLTELKTSSSSDPARFVWQALRLYYHAQMRMQQIACADSLVQDCFIVCVESAEPYPVTVFQIDPKALEAGEKLLILWAERLKNSEVSAQFPPYAQSIMPIMLPDEEIELDYSTTETGEI